MINRFEVRNFVQKTVENIFKGNITEDLMNNIRLIFEYDEEMGFWGSELCVKQWLYDKWEICGYINLNKYYANYWELVTQPWECDMINDTTDLVMKFIQEPKKKEF